MSVALSVPLNPRSMRMFFAVLANSEKLGAIFFWSECDSNSSARYREKFKLADSESTN